MNKKIQKHTQNPKSYHNRRQRFSGGIDERFSGSVVMVSEKKKRRHPESGTEGLSGPHSCRRYVCPKSGSWLIDHCSQKEFFQRFIVRLKTTDDEIVVNEKAEKIVGLPSFGDTHPPVNRIIFVKDGDSGP
jgi:hypothetical protein